MIKEIFLYCGLDLLSRYVKRLLIDHNDANACRKHLCYSNSRESTVLWKVDEPQIVGKPFSIQNKVHSHSHIIQTALFSSK